MMERTAPHLTRPLSWLLPLTTSVSFRQEGVARVGSWAGDALRAATHTSRDTLAELVFGVTYEGAVDAEDLLDRRPRLGFLPEDRTAALPWPSMRSPSSDRPGT